MLIHHAWSPMANGGISWFPIARLRLSRILEDHINAIRGRKQASVTIYGNASLAGITAKN